jgi:D-alanine-D-alanine ligase
MVASVLYTNCMQTVIGVLRGGPSREHDVSLKTGHAIASSLPPDKFTVKDIYIDRQGVWHDRGRPVTPVQALRSVDAVLIGLHGEFGEDGEVQKLLEQCGVPYAGARPLPSFRAMHKVLAKHEAKNIGLKVARDVFIEKAEDAEEMAKLIIRTLPQPVVVKPIRWGSSVGVQVVGGFQPVHKAIQDLFAEGAEGVLVEERIRGTEATAGVIENLRNEDLYALPIVEIIPPEGDFFSYGSKYSGQTNEICPGRFPYKVSQELQDAARRIHQALELRHYSRSDFIVSPNGIYYLETNTLPGLTSESLLPKSLSSIGVTFPDFLSHLVDLSLNT